MARRLLTALEVRQAWMGCTRSLRVAVLILGVLGWGPGAYALDPALDVSQYAHTAWKIREGFTKGTIFSTAQTPDGYLWLGTEFGLVRFDGVQAIPWQPPGGEQLPSSWINALLVTRDGTLWIGTEKGLASWKDGKLTEYPEVAGLTVTSLLQDAEGTLWFGVRDPGRLCAVRAAKTQCYGAGSLGWSVPALYEDHKGNLWVSAQSGLWRWAPGPPEQYQLPGGPVEAKALIEGDHGELLMATGMSGPFTGPVIGVTGGLKELVGGKIRDYALPGIAGEFRPTRLFRSGDGSLWIGTMQGLLHIHQGRIDGFSVTDGLSGNFIRRIFEDREGNVWVCTENGLDRFREFAAPTISENQGLSASAAYLVEATLDGSVWTATADGPNRWQNGHVTVYGKRSRSGLNNRTDAGELVINAKATEIANSGIRGTVRSLGQDDRGRLWAGSPEGVFYFDRGRFVQVPSVPGGNILSIAGDGHGKVWISNLDQGLFYSTTEAVVQRFPWVRFGHKYGAVALLPDRLQGGLWLGFFDGGIVYLKDGQLLSSYNVGDGLGNGSVNDLQLGSDGAVWAATEGGLSRVKEGFVATITSRNGLPCDAVNSVIEGDDRSLWLYMACGLVRIARPELDAWVSDSKRSVRTTVFDNSDGVRARALAGGHSRLVAKSPDGKIWFSPPDGVSVINPRHVPFNNLPPPVYVQQITADGKKYDASPGLRLPARIHDLSIDYTALSLVAPEKVRFRFKLEGQDRDWREVLNDRQVQYSNLGPGDYRFRVTACNNSGVWNEEGAALDFVIPPAWYQTNWFRILCAVALLALVWALYQLRVRQLAQQFNMRLDERVNERTRIARDLHDTLLQSFHGLMLRFQAAYNLYETNPKEAQKTLGSAIDQAAGAITEGRDAVQGLRTSTVERNDLALAISAVGEELAGAETNPNGAKFHVGVEGTPRELHPILRDEVYRIAGEAMRNAFKHAQARRIEVEIHYDERRFRLRVRDDGKGIDARLLSDGRAGHYGLRGMRERAKLLGGKLTVWSELDAGTEVELKIPAANAYESAGGRGRSWFAEKLAGKGTGTDKEQ